MEITCEILLERIEADPIKHLGGYSPKLIYTYFAGYEHARNFHSWSKIGGQLSMSQFNDWFMNNAYRGPQGWASFCELLTDTEEEALKLFFEFRKLAKKAVGAAGEHNDTVSGTSETKLSMIELITADAIRNRPAMYFGNSHWTTGMWAMWHGYVSAEKDMDVENSPDCIKFTGFQKWLWERHPFAKDKNWGKLFQFLGMDVNANALEQFYDHLDLFLEEESPTAHTKRFQEFLDVAVAAALKEQNKSR